MGNFQSIQVLRYLAATLVMLAHVGVGSHSYKGIDMLFAISGFVLYLSCHKKSGTGLVSAINFLKKRCIRVYSFYWLALFFLLFSGLYSLKFDFNFFKVVFLLPTHQSFLSLTWSLSYELYFYGLMMLMIAFFSPTKAPKIILIFWLICTFFLLLQWTDYSLKRRPINFLIGQNIWQILTGCLACMLFLKNNRWKDKLPFQLISFLFVSSIVLFFAYASYDNTLSFLLTGLGSAGIVLSLVMWEHQYHNKIPLLFVRLGNASYVAYLIHLPLFHLFKKQIDQNLTMQVILIGFIWALSIFLHEKAEKPLVSKLNHQFVPATQKIHP